MAELIYNEKGRLLFTEEMKKEYTILIPMMLPIHFALLEKIFIQHGYNMKLLKTNHRRIVDEGLRNVHNDTCYPALLVIGQFLDALKSGEYDINKTALMITQTGGGCRASNYINLLRKALKNNGFEQVPVVSLNMSNMEKNPGFKLSVKLLYQLVSAICYGDVLMWAANQVRPYEINKGDADALVDKWVNELIKSEIGIKGFKEKTARMIKEFEAIPVKHEEKIRVGIVGEIYIKYAPLGNNCLEEFLQSEGAEVVVPGLLDFIIFMCDHHIVDTKIYHVRYKKYIGSAALKVFLVSMQDKLISNFENSRFRAPQHFEKTKSFAAEYVSTANKMGEGWLLTAEMLELIHSGVENIVCGHPLGSLPNHIVGKGMIRSIRQKHPDANIVAVDYDPGATKVNQENRIKLMLSTAKENLKNK
ncbi:MAG TPA: 2-hydroxyacyl-CoA dehydratase [Oscillospiraceae bacterium]|nr:2-hydroxyacyl-CoA dehydratase [Oscillospiraceae bacterium]